MDDDTSDSPQAAALHPNIGGLLVGRYRIRARLGRGATKEVYLAYDERLDREVALAIVVGASGELARARVTREAQVTGRLGDHPNVITVYDSGELEGVPYLVLRAMRGGSLADLIERRRPSFADAIRLGGEIAAALAHAHAHGVVHRDVKPDNVWLASDGRAALGDFGIAHQVGLERLTADGIVVGTVRYLSPEQIRGEDIGPAGDLYALGVTLYELATGRPPFTAPTQSQVLTQHLTVAPEAPSRHEPQIPTALERLILELLAKRPARRPESASRVVELLGRIEAPQGDAQAARRRPGPARDTAAPAATPSGVSTTRRRQPDTRRVVAVLAVGADVADPEALHGVLDRCAAVIERHGGRIERYLGDALLAIFGLDASQGDDALRAARAAVDLGAVEPGRRVAIESGEVFLGTDRGGAPIATGAPISAAVRLADRAGPGEILLGDGARSAIGPDATVDPQTGALLALQAERPALLRSRATPFVGRGGELDVLRSAFAQVRDEGTCRLVTVVGAPGIGKSRLAGEFLTALGAGATVLAGRCVAYGEGTTYRALAEIVGGLGGDPRRRVEELLAGDEPAIRGLLGAIGLSDEPAQVDETSWALRRLLRRLARERPLVVAVEDIHWAEPALLDLLDHVVALCSGSPILLVCLTRPELLEAQPAWGVSQPNRLVLTVDALADADARELAELLGAGGPAARIAARAEGNPLFVEQLVAVGAGGDDELPASIQAVLAARIDRLDDDERLLLQHAAVEGRTFHRGPLAAAVADGERAAIGASLAALADKGLIGTDQPGFAGEEAFRFTHALIRDAAYAGISKERRASLHGGLAGWLERRPAAADEIVGFHLEQACLLLRELGRRPDAADALATRAVQRLETASSAAQARGDPSAASQLLQRAIAVAGADEHARGALLPALGASLYEAGRMTEATRVLDEAIAGATEPRLGARARVEREFVRLETDTSSGTAQALRVSEAAMAALQHDVYGQYRVWSLRAQVAWAAGHVRRADDAWCEAARCARHTSDERALFDALGWRATAAAIGPLHVDEAIGLCERFRDEVAASPVAVAWMLNPLGVLHAMTGDFERALHCIERANDTLYELGHLDASVSHHEAYVRLLAGRPELAEAALRAGVTRLAAMSDGRLMATTTALLAQALHAQRRDAEATEQCERTARAAAADDTVSQVIWRTVRARILAQDGHCDDARRLAGEAVELVRSTDLLTLHGDALSDLAEVLRRCVAGPASDDALRAAVVLYEAKGNAVAVARARSRAAQGAAG